MGVTSGAKRRIVPQLELGRKNGSARVLLGKGEQLVAALPQLLSGRAPGRFASFTAIYGVEFGLLADAHAVLFDPAVYRGDREADLA